MGLFSYIRCEYPLDCLDEVIKEMENPPDWEEFEFQTKSLDSLMETYSIEEDGQLYKEACEREMVEKNGRIEITENPTGVERQNYSGDFYMYGFHLDKDYDFFMELKLLFWKGELKEIELVNWEKSSNKTRLQSQKLIEDTIKDKEKRKEKLWYKIYLPFFKIISSIFGSVRWLLGYAVKLTWKIENLLRK